MCSCKDKNFKNLDIGLSDSPVEAHGNFRHHLKLSNEQLLKSQLKRASRVSQLKRVSSSYNNKVMVDCNANFNVRL